MKGLSLSRWLAIAAGVGLATMFWKELPSMRRYIKIERM